MEQSLMRTEVAGAKIGDVGGAEPLQLGLELDGGGDPIAGRLRDGNGSSREFVGWLELTRAIEDARAGASSEELDTAHAGV